MAKQRRATASPSLRRALLGELGGCCLLLLLLLPLCARLEGRGLGWAAAGAHFVGVIALDVLSAATLSPAFCLGLALLGRMPLGEAAARAAVDMGAAFACTALLDASGLMAVRAPKPAPGVTPSFAFASEALLTAVFFAVVLVVSTKIPAFAIRRPIVALSLRVLLVLGAPFSGPVLNPMIALPFAWFSGAVTRELCLVYCLGPVTGVLGAAALWTLSQAVSEMRALLPKKRRKTKAR